MTDRPILFSAPMIRALRAGRKTQTRRALKDQPSTRGVCGLPLDEGLLSWPRGAGAYRVRHISKGAPDNQAPISVGYRLWVREAFSYDTLDVDHDGLMPAWYWADGNPEDGDWTRPKPSIHMPRWASRLTLTVTDVKVERLWAITDVDATAEGVEFRQDGGWGTWDSDGKCICGGADHPREGFRCLWININGTASWDHNPYVAVYSFTVEQRNIDA